VGTAAFGCPVEQSSTALSSPLLARNFCYFFPAAHTKFAASLASPLPLYFAVGGYGNNGVRHRGVLPQWLGPSRKSRGNVRSNDGRA